MSSKRTPCRITIEDEVNCLVVGLHPTDEAKLYEQYGLFAPNHFFNPRFKLGIWDGKLRFFQKSGQTLVYLLDEIIPKLVKMGYAPRIEDLRKGPYVEAKNIHKDVFAHVLKGGNPMALRYYQVDAVNALLADGKGMIEASTSAGKAQPLTAKVLTPSGWKLMGDVKIGDQVQTPSGRIANVVGIFPQGTKPINKITFTDGATTEACDDHLWLVNLPTTKSGIKTERKVVDTKFIKSRMSTKCRRQISVPIAGSMLMSNLGPLPLSPYLLGALIGDGGFTNNTISFTNVDPFILAKVDELCRHHMVSLTGKNGKDFSVTKVSGRYGTRTNPLTEIIRRLGLINTTSSTKFIPEAFKNSSIADRWDLIRGLFDTDGTVDTRHNVSFSTSSEQLAKDVQDILWSLGVKCSITSKIPHYTYGNEKREGRTSYTLFVRHTDNSMFFSTPRKVERCIRTKPERDWRFRTIKSIEYVRDDLAQCIMLDDEDHLYVTDDFIVTHNTWINAALVNAYGVQGLRTITIVPSTSLVIQTIKDFRDAEMDVGEYTGKTKDLEHQHIISTWQALKNHPEIMQRFQVVVVDEVHQAKSKILNELVNIHGAHIPYRFGLTGTLPKDPVERLTIHNAFGDVKYTIPAHELIEQDFISSVEVTIAQLFENHPSGYFPDFTAERSYLQIRKERLAWIADTVIEKAAQPKGNAMILVSSVGIGKKLQKLIPNSVFLHGSDSAEDRKKVYDLFETNDNMIVIATVQIAGTGLSIDRIFNLFLVDIGKSFTRVIQAIGRGLRKGGDKDHVNVYDVCSTLKYSKKHLAMRIQYYNDAKYPFTKTVVKYRDYNDKFDMTQDDILKQIESETSLDY